MLITDRKGKLSFQWCLSVHGGGGGLGYIWSLVLSGVGYLWSDVSWSRALGVGIGGGRVSMGVGYPRVGYCRDGVGYVERPIAPSACHCHGQYASYLNAFLY